MNAAGIGSVAPASMMFTIRPPLWQRWWVLSLAAAALGMAAFALHRARLARVIELARVRMRIATDLHDDIGASLSQIAILSEVASRELTTDTAPAGETLSSIAGTARELVDAMSDIVWAIDPSKDAVQDLRRRMRRFAADMVTACAMDMRISQSDHDEFVTLGADLRRNVFLIFKESVTNSVRHSGCANIAIELHVDRTRGVLRLRVTDDGRGMTTTGDGDAGASNGEGHGLASMQARARAIGGTLTFSTPQGGGTIVTLAAPLVGPHTRMW